MDSKTSFNCNSFGSIINFGPNQKYPLVVIGYFLTKLLSKNADGNVILIQFILSLMTGTNLPLFIQIYNTLYRQTVERFRFYKNTVFDILHGDNCIYGITEYQIS